MHSTAPTWLTGAEPIDGSWALRIRSAGRGLRKAPAARRRGGGCPLAPRPGPPARAYRGDADQLALRRRDEEGQCIRVVDIPADVGVHQDGNAPAGGRPGHFSPPTRSPVVIWREKTMDRRTIGATIITRLG